MFSEPQVVDSKTGCRSVMALLFLAYLLSFADRIAFGLVLKPIKMSLSLSDTQAGVLVGASFAVSYAVFSPLGGWIVDRHRRRNVLAFAVAFWSLATLSCGLATSVVLMGVARVAVGAGEALLHPLAVSIVSDVVPAKGRANAFAIYLSAGAFGAVSVWLFGGALVHALSAFPHLALPAVGRIEPWQALFITLAIPGIALAVIVVLLMKEPPRGSATANVAGRRATSVSTFVRAHPRLALAILVGCPLNLMAGVALLSWLFVAFDRIYGWPAGKSGQVIGLTCGVMFIIGCLLSGRMVEALRKQGYADASLRASVAGAIAFAVFSSIGIEMPNPYACIGCMAFAFALGYLPAVGAYTAISEVVPESIRAAFTGITTLIVGLVTNSLGPFMVGLLSDHLFKGTDGIRYAIIATMMFGAIVGSGFCARGFASLREHLHLESTDSIGAPSASAEVAESTKRLNAS